MLSCQFDVDPAAVLLITLSLPSYIQPIKYIPPEVFLQNWDMKYIYLEIVLNGFYSLNFATFFSTSTAYHEPFLQKTFVSAKDMRFCEKHVFFQKKHAFCKKHAFLRKVLFSGKMCNTIRIEIKKQLSKFLNNVTFKWKIPLEKNPTTY